GEGGWRDGAQPARNVRGLAVPRTREGIAVGREARLVLGEIRQRPEGDPLLPRPAPGRREHEADQRNRQQRGREGVERDAERQQHAAPGGSCALALLVPSHAPPPRCDATPAPTPPPPCGVRGAAAAPPRQSGIPRSGRPATTAVRSAWSLTSAR